MSREHHMTSHVGTLCNGWGFVLRWRKSVCFSEEDDRQTTHVGRGVFGWYGTSMEDGIGRAGGKAEARPAGSNADSQDTIMVSQSLEDPHTRPTTDTHGKRQHQRPASFNGKMPWEAYHAQFKLVADGVRRRKQLTLQ